MAGTHLSPAAPGPARLVPRGVRRRDGRGVRSRRSPTRAATVLPRPRRSGCGPRARSRAAGVRVCTSTRARQDLSYAVRTLATHAGLHPRGRGDAGARSRAHDGRRQFHRAGRAVAAAVSRARSARARLERADPRRRQSRSRCRFRTTSTIATRQTAFAALAAHTGTSVAMVIGGVPRQMPGVLTTPELHEVLGVHPMLGRGADRRRQRARRAAASCCSARRSGGRSSAAAPTSIGEVVQVDGRAHDDRRRAARDLQLSARHRQLLVSAHARSRAPASAARTS